MTFEDENAEKFSLDYADMAALLASSRSTLKEKKKKANKRFFMNVSTEYS